MKERTKAKLDTVRSEVEFMRKHMKDPELFDDFTDAIYEHIVSSAPTFDNEETLEKKLPTFRKALSDLKAALNLSPAAQAKLEELGADINAVKYAAETACSESSGNYIRASDFLEDLYFVGLGGIVDRYSQLGVRTEINSSFVRLCDQIGKYVLPYALSREQISYRVEKYLPHFLNNIQGEKDGG